MKLATLVADRKTPLLVLASAELPEVLSSLWGYRRE